MAAFSWSLWPTKMGDETNHSGRTMGDQGDNLCVFFRDDVSERYKTYMTNNEGYNLGMIGIACYDRSIEISRYIFMN